MSLDDFNISPLVGALNGGIINIESALINQSGKAQRSSAATVQEIFTSRIDAALNKLSSSNSSAISDKLLRDQSQLISNKERLTETVGVLSKAINQIGYLKSHIEYLRDQLTYLENGDLTHTNVSTDWDNHLTTINKIVWEAAEAAKDGDNVFQRNLIDRAPYTIDSRTSFGNESIHAPYNSNAVPLNDGDLFQIDGTYLGTDYFITEDGSSENPGHIWNSDTAFLEASTDVGVLTEYKSDFDTKTKQTAKVTDISVISYNDATGAISFKLGDWDQRMNDIEPNNTYLTAQEFPRQGFQIDASNIDIPNTAAAPRASTPWASIKGTLNNSGVTTTAGQDYDWFKIELQKGETLLFDVDYGYNQGDSVDTFLDFFDEAGAIADASVHTTRGSKSPNALFGNDDGSTTAGYVLADDNGSVHNWDTYLHTTVAKDDTYYVRVRAYSRTDSGDYVIQMAITADTTSATSGDNDATTESTGLGPQTISGTITGGGLALHDAWVYSNFNNQASIDQAWKALDLAESQASITQGNLVNDRLALLARSSVFDAQINGISKQVADLVEDVQDGSRAELLARQLEYVLATFDAQLLASRGNSLVQSMLISNGSDISSTTNAGRIALTIGTTINVST
jgi:hypothetical protein